ncbi:MAG: TldD/PmbA family protein [Planctomycetes bacterium]|jgi:TldD protein|nr:TldD/PmbA family protein [Planctomycetota bacterium]
MMDRVEDVLRKFKGRCDYLEARVEEGESVSIVLRGRSIDAVRESVSLGGCVRAYHKGGTGFSCFNSLDRFPEFAEKVIAQARLVGSGETKLAAVPPVRAEVKARPKKDPRTVPLREKLAVLQGYNDRILSFDKRIPTSGISYGDGFRRVFFGNSEGARLAYEKIDIGCNITAIALGGGQTQFGSVGCGSSDDFDCVFGLEEEIDEECRAAVELLDAPLVKGGVYTAVLDPHMAGVFVHEAFGHMSEGEKVAFDPKEAEVMRLGKTFGSPVLNIFDSGVMPGTRGQIPFDEEGVPAQRTDLIRGGVLVGRLHTRETAGRMGEAATGSARALSHQFPPVPRMRSTCIEAGTSSFEEMIADVDLGIYAVKAMGGQAGEMFTFTPARCRMIRQGKVAELVKGAILSGNLFTTLKNIDAVGSDFLLRDAGGGCGKGTPEGFQFPLPVSHGAPHVRIRDVVIGGQ